eukprot:TRINITY_DN3166_c0_g1_i1.p1 TRINITY_DN3166_c0_g1~~TRINITY_DN3166_c0_g1_i1.p1  ORF type:complete len:198 (+),score=24.55 TRINITY_DN3166_c0_g1_i1:64-657(+)
MCIRDRYERNKSELSKQNLYQTLLKKQLTMTPESTLNFSRELGFKTPMTSGIVGSINIHVNNTKPVVAYDDVSDDDIIIDQSIKKALTMPKPVLAPPLTEREVIKMYKTKLREINERYRNLKSQIADENNLRVEYKNQIESCIRQSRDDNLNGKDFIDQGSNLERDIFGLPKRGYQIWHLLLISAIFLVLGSLITGN